jgi:hypothetical protein
MPTRLSQPQRFRKLRQSLRKHRPRTPGGTEGRALVQDRLIEAWLRGSVLLHFVVRKWGLVGLFPAPYLSILAWESLAPLLSASFLTQPTFFHLPVLVFCSLPYALSYPCQLQPRQGRVFTSKKHRFQCRFPHVFRKECGFYGSFCARRDKIGRYEPTPSGTRRRT